MYFWKAAVGMVSVVTIVGSSVSAFQHQPYDEPNFTPPLRPRVLDSELEARDLDNLHTFAKRAPIFYWHSPSGEFGLNIDAQTGLALTGCIAAGCSIAYIRARGLNTVIAEISAHSRLTADDIRTGVVRALDAGVRGATGDQQFSMDDIVSRAYATATSAPQASQTSHSYVQPAADDHSHSHSSDASHARPGQVAQRHSQDSRSHSSSGTSHAPPARHNSGTHRRNPLDFMFDDDLLFARDLLSLYEDGFDF